MAKVLRTVAVIAGAVALVATGIGAIGGAAFAATALGGTIASIATWATVVAGVAGIGANLLTKPPPARGSVTETIIEIDPPSPYGMGEGYFAGVMRHRVGYGPTLKKVPNPFLFEALALSVAGPIAGPITPQVDFGPVTSYYSGWLATDTRLGARPDTALTAPLQANPTGWSTNHRMSSVAAIAWNHRFDKEGKVYASGLPTRGVVARWALVYDPRKDSTRPGGSGSHRLGIESTYEWSENPALHAGTYAYGRYVNGKRVIGVGLPDEGIDWEGVAAWANDCQANGWRMFGFVFEGAADDDQRRWQNLRDICIAGGGQPLFSGAVLGFHWHRPRVPLDTVTEADLADGPQEVTAMQSWRDRLNTVRPRYTSAAHNWSLVQANAVQVASYVTEDGEERAEDIPFNFVKDVNQAAQLAAYWLVNSREISPITLTLMPRLRSYRPGECLRLELPELGLDHDAVILRREFDPATMTVTLTLVTEDPAKHAFALGRTGVAPPTPALTNSAEDRDTITREARAPYWPEVDGPGRPEDGANVTAPANANRVPLSRMEGDRGWGVLFNPSALAVSPFYGTFGGRRYFAALFSATTSGQVVSIGQSVAPSAAFPVTPGERLSVQARVDAFGPISNWGLFIWWVRSDGSRTQATVAGGATGVGAANNQQGFLTAPTDSPEVVGAHLELAATSNGPGTVQLAFFEPMVTSAAVGQTVHPPFTPGPNARDGADPNSDITVDGGGVLSGIGTANINVDNRRAALQGLASARPASGQFVGQEYHATDTGAISQWDGFNWRTSADITASAQISFSEPAPFQIQADSAGVTTTNLATQTRSITLRRGGVAQTSGVTVGTPTASPSPAIAVASATVSAGVVTVTLSAANASGSVTIPVIFNGVTYPVTIPVNRTIAAPVAGGSGSQPFTDQTWSNINSTTYTAVTDAGSTVLSSSGGQLQFSYSAQYQGGIAQCKAQYSTDGTTWLDVTGSEVTGSPPITVPGEEAPGDISRSPVTQTGLAGSTLYHVRLVARRTAGSTTLSWLAPTFTARQP